VRCTRFAYHVWPDLEPAIDGVDVEVARAADDVAVRLADDERHRPELVAHVERGIDPLARFRRRRNARVPERHSSPSAPALEPASCSRASGSIRRACLRA
jgi:hypothetical protein